MEGPSFFPKFSKIFESYSHATYDVSQVSLDFTQQFFGFLGQGEEQVLARLMRLSFRSHCWAMLDVFDSDFFFISEPNSPCLVVSG